MAIQIQNLDLQEQEQLDQLKHFWRKWGNLIVWGLIAALGAVAAWNGWQYWQRKQGVQAAALYAELERAVVDGELPRAEQALGDIRAQSGGTLYAAQGALLAASVLKEKNKVAEAKAALAWVADKGSDEGLRAIARLRLASILMDEKAYDEAGKQLSASFPPAFVALAADRRGDLYVLQGRRFDAVTEYGKAYQGLDPNDRYRLLVGMKLGALGVDPDVRRVSPSGAAS
ncbi:MAG: tetratricopeptide repeat protein [Burkholderiaceae bacterium]|jgi:predicted negative regulator of RcsB-dependent stress response|nr:tetratricopeptide repeat protein [Burkholderiaceae bacterium]